MLGVINSPGEEVYSGRGSICRVVRRLYAKTGSPSCCDHPFIVSICG